MFSTILECLLQHHVDSVYNRSLQLCVEIECDTGVDDMAGIRSVEPALSEAITMPIYYIMYPSIPSQDSE